MGSGNPEGTRPKNWRGKLAEEFAEKFAGNSPKIRGSNENLNPNPHCRNRGSRFLFIVLRVMFVDAAFLLTIGSFLLTAELLCLQSCLGAFCLQFDFFAYNSSFFAYS